MITLQSDFVPFSNLSGHGLPQRPSNQKVNKLGRVTENYGIYLLTKNMHRNAFLHLLYIIQTLATGIATLIQEINKI